MKQDSDKKVCGNNILFNIQNITNIVLLNTTKASSTDSRRFTALLAGKSDDLGPESPNFLLIWHYYPLNLPDFYKLGNIGLPEAEPPLFVLKMLSPVKFDDIFPGVARSVKFTIGGSHFVHASAAGDCGNKIPTRGGSSDGNSWKVQ